MARLMTGIILVVCFIVSLIVAAVLYPPLTPPLIALLGIALFAPGIALIVAGRRRISLFRKAGAAIIASARKTGRVSVADIAAGTQTDPDDVRMVAAALVKGGIMPRDTEVS